MSPKTALNFLLELIEVRNNLIQSKLLIYFTQYTDHPSRLNPILLLISSLWKRRKLERYCNLMKL